MQDNKITALLETIRHGVVAGVAGGVAEIAWVILYAGATGADPATVASGVTTAAGLSALFPAAPVAVGVTVHMALAVTLGIALSFGWRALSSHRLECAGPFPFMLAALVGVWAVNFFVGAADHQSRVYPPGALSGQPDVESTVRARGGGGSS